MTGPAWTPTTTKRNERARSTTSASLLASVNRLAELVENEPAAEAESKPNPMSPTAPKTTTRGSAQHRAARTDG